MASRFGIATTCTKRQESIHVEGLERRLRDGWSRLPDAAVVVHADTVAPVRGAWNVQVFHGLGDKGYTHNPRFLQRRQWPRARTGAAMVARRMGVSWDPVAPPKRLRRRASRYQQVNAYGPRFADALEELLDADISRFGHIALNDRADVSPDAAGPVLWLPTWDNSRYLGGPNQSSVASFAEQLAGEQLAVKYHPRTIADNQDAAARGLLHAATVIPADDSPYDWLGKARGILTDTSSLGFEAACMGFPVAILKPPGVHLGGLHDELESYVPTFAPGDPTLADWIAKPTGCPPRAWRDDLLEPPAARRNDDFVQGLLDEATK